MTNTVLTKNESKILSVMITFLRIHGFNRLADRVERVKFDALNGLIPRLVIFNGVVREAAFCAISLACREKNGLYVLDFSIFLENNGDLSRNKSLAFLCHFTGKLDPLGDGVNVSKIDYSKPICPDHSNCPGWIQGYGCDSCDYRPV